VLDLTVWNHNHFQHLRRDIDTCLEKIECAQSKLNSGNVNYFNSLRQHMSQLLLQEDFIGISVRRHTGYVMVTLIHSSLMWLHCLGGKSIVLTL
jgi:hypothetical protein